MDSFDSTGTLKTIARGILAGDLIVRTAILEGIKDLRSKPWLLKYCFAGLTQDELTRDVYGQLEVDRAIEWFIKTDIPVFLNIRTDTSKFPCISIKLASSADAEATLGDVNWQPQEDADYAWNNLAGPFVGQYNYDTGVVTLPDSTAQQIVLAENQVLIDATNRAWTIEQVLNFTQVKISKNLKIDLSKTFVRGQPPGYVTTLESMLFKETYQIGCHASAEAVHLVYLHSIVTFILLMYKQSLLEARNLERTQIQSSDLVQNTTFENELVYSRYINLTGYCEQSWPKTISQKITAFNYGIRIADSGHLFTDAEAATQLWIGELDSVGTGSLPISPVGGENPAEKRASGAGYPLVYWGVANTGMIDAAFIQALSFNQPQAGRQTPSDIQFNSTGSTYCWYAYPAVYGGVPANMIDDGTGFEFGMSNVATVSVTDSFGIIRSYFVWKSNNAHLGFVYLKVT